MSKSLKLPSGVAKRLPAFLIGVSVVLLVGGACGFYLLHNKQIEADKVVDEKQAQVGSNEQIARKYQVTLDAYNATMEQLKFLEPAMTKQSYVPTMVQQLQRYSTADHLKVVTVRPGQMTDPVAPTKAAGASGGSTASTTTKAAPPPYRQMTMQVSVEGTYTQIMAFVYHLTRFPKIVSVQSISFSPHVAASDTAAFGKSPLLGADIGLIAYVFDDVKPAPASNGTVTTLAGAVISADNGNPIAQAAGRVADVTRADMKKADLHDRTGGLIEPAAAGTHSIKGGLGSEQNTVR